MTRQGEIKCCPITDNIGTGSRSPDQANSVVDAFSMLPITNQLQETYSCYF